MAGVQKGKVAVAILTTAVADGEAVDFDAAEVDPRTVAAAPIIPFGSSANHG
jgi:hypothetical protein